MFNKLIVSNLNSREIGWEYKMGTPVAPFY